MILPTLYGYASDGSIKQWTVSTSGSAIRVEHGKLGGKLQTKETLVTKGKNIGKANETTPVEQAEAEAKSKWNKQIKKSYCEDIDNITPLGNPMLAHDYRKRSHNIKWPCYSQPKLDGLRALISCVDGEIILKSRGGETYPVPSQIKEGLEPVFKERPDVILDGEMYIHGVPLNQISGAVKKVKPLSSALTFVCFDLVVEGCTMTWEMRHAAGKLLFSNKTTEYICFLDHKKVSNHDEAMKIHDFWVKRGYEGLMLRNAKGLYKLDHRSEDLQKFKVFKDKEYEIVAVVPDKDGRGKFICVAPEANPVDGDYTFGVCLGTHEERETYLAEPERWIGKFMKVKYQVLTAYGFPMFPVGLEIRDKGEF